MLTSNFANPESSGRSEHTIKDGDVITRKSHAHFRDWIFKPLNTLY